MAKELVQVVLMSDDDGHDYLIPSDSKDDFSALCEASSSYWDNPDKYPQYEQDANKFEDEFSKYRVEGNIPALYTEKGYEDNFN